MKKSDIESIVKDIPLLGSSQSIGDVGALANVQIMGKEVLIDLLVQSPSLQSRKKIEVHVGAALKEKLSDDYTCKIKVKHKNLPQEKLNLIKGKPLKGVQNIIAIASGKGGVGKSTVTANLAVTLSNMGFKVGVLDADIYGPSMPLMFDVAFERPLSVQVDGKSKMKPIENYGVQLLSIGFFTKPNQAVIWRGPMASKALNQMIFDADWGELEFLLIDLPPGTGDIHLSILQALPVTGAVVVSTPQAIALADARKGVSMFQQDSIQVPVLGIVENMSYFTPEQLPENKYYIFGRDGAKYLAEDIDVPFLGDLPLVQGLREAGDVGRPAVLQGGAIENAFTSITQSLITQIVQRNKELPPTEIVKITTMAGCSAVS
ncbi:MAG: Mrp/NBP35 family ATP-binding protein [Bacteroidota bacterium]|nr:Mrp/NBP35 family ATP-binding protein [Bacteroidota bacterium]